MVCAEMRAGITLCGTFPAATAIWRRLLHSICPWPESRARRKLGRARAREDWQGETPAVSTTAQ